MERNFSAQLMSAAIVPIALLLLVACAGPNAEIRDRNLQATEGVIDLLESDESITLADSRIVCENRRVVGSNLRKRICMLESEKDRLRRSNMDGFYGVGHGFGGSQRPADARP